MSKILRELVATFGKEFTLQLRTNVLGLAGNDTCQYIVDNLALPVTAEEFCQKFRERTIVETADCDLMPGTKHIILKLEKLSTFIIGAERLVKHLHKNKIPIAIATSSRKEAIDVKIRKHHHVFQLFHHTVSAGSDDAVKQGKPSPDIFLVCASRFPDNPKPENVLVLEDSSNGIKGAVAAGMQTVIVPDKLLDPSKYTEAMFVIHSLEDFRPELFGLPPF